VFCQTPCSRDDGSSAELAPETSSDANRAQAMTATKFQREFMAVLP